MNETLKRVYKFPGIVAYFHKPSTGEREAGGPEVLGPPQLCIQFGVNLASMRSCFKKSSVGAKMLT